MKRFASVFAVSALFVLTACTQQPGTNNPLFNTPNGSGAGNTPTLVQSDQLTIVSSTEVFAASGQSTQLQVKDATGQTLNPASIEFSSSQPNAISVNAMGQVTAMARGGSTVITATLKGTSVRTQKRFSVN
jgi:hypothetical protein